MGTFVSVLLLVYLVVQCRGAPARRTMISFTFSQQVHYLSQYGFMRQEVQGMEMSVTDGLLDFQRFYGLQQTGLLDSATQRLMSTARCGVRDRNFGRRKKRFLAERWRKREIKYFIESYPPQFTREFVLQEFNRSVEGGWQRFAPGLVLRRTDYRNEASIVVNFLPSAVHNSRCHEPFGRNTLGHAAPPEDGQIHFNIDHDFYTNQDRLLDIIIHEFGHALGLDHVSDPNSVMYSYVGHKNHFSDESIGALEKTYSYSSPNAPEPHCNVGGYCARLFEHSKCFGLSLNIHVGNYQYIGDEFNDKTTTLQVKHGCTLVLYDDHSFEKWLGEFHGGFHHLSTNKNDRASSMTCHC